jgi:hypothetical protein
MSLCGVISVVFIMLRKKWFILSAILKIRECELQRNEFLKYLMLLPQP